MKDETERAEILDRCLERIRLGEDPEGVLGEHPDMEDEIRPLLSVAEDLRLLPDPLPSVDGLMRSMVRLTAAGGPAAPVRKPRFFGPRLWLRAAAALLIILVGGWGTVSASAQAMPGDILYPVKRFTERARFFLTVSSEGKAELRIQFSSERLREAVAKLERGEGADESLLREMLDEARRAADDFEDIPTPRRNLLAIRAAHVSESQKETLDRLQKAASPEDRKILVTYRDRCGRREEWVREIIDEKVLTPDEDVPPDRIRRWKDSCPDCGGGCR